jgi:hypothetical protein
VERVLLRWFGTIKGKLSSVENASTWKPPSPIAHDQTMITTASSTTQASLLGRLSEDF